MDLSEGQIDPQMRGNHIRDAFCEGEQNLDGGRHPPSRAGNRTFTPRNLPRIPDLQFVQILETTICYFTPFFLDFGGPTPLECPDSRPLAVQTALEVEQTRPVRMLCSDLGQTQMFSGYHPKHAAIHAFATVATAASLHAGPCAHMRAQMSASEPNLVAVHEPCGRTCSEERAARHLTLYGAAGAARAPHAMPGGHLRGCARAAGTSPSCARCW